MRPIDGLQTPTSLRRKPGRAPAQLPLLLAGVALGVVFSLITFGVVYAVGMLPIVEVQGAVAICPPTPGFYPQCATCSPLFDQALSTPEPPTATLDLAATATSACSTFQALFPGTPCP